MSYWDKYQAAKAWGISPAYAMLVMRRVPGAELRIENGKTKWVIPAGTKKPTRTYERPDEHAV